MPKITPNISDWHKQIFVQLCAHHGRNFNKEIEYLILEEYRRVFGVTAQLPSWEPTIGNELIDRYAEGE